jgi:UMF1 family MFS transporter
MRSVQRFAVDYTGVWRRGSTPKAPSRGCGDCSSALYHGERKILPMAPNRAALGEGVRPAEVFAWAMYDFANSGYTTVVLTAVFNTYFVAVIAGNAPWATFAWTAALSVSYACILLTAPVLGAYADLRAAKKRLLVFTTAGCVAATALLAVTGPGTLAVAVALLVISNFCFGSGENIVAAFLPELAQGEALGRVSGWGWSLGYLGGLLTLAVCLGYVTWAQSQGEQAQQFVPVTMLITAATFAAASLPTFLILRERARAVPPVPGENVARAAFARLAQTLRDAARYRDLARFLVCIVFYQAGIQTVIVLAAIYAEQALGFSTKETITLILVVNLTAGVGAFAFGYIQDRLGHARTIALTLVLWIATTLAAWAASGPGLFWVAANLAGFCLGSSQSAGRALVGYLSPLDRRAEFFGLWGLAVKLASILGPITYGAVTWITGGNHRLAMLATGGFFVVGLLILAGIDVPRGRRAASQS